MVCVFAGNKTAQLGPDLISRFLETAVKTDTPISNKELRDIVLNFIIAGLLFLPLPLPHLARDPVSRFLEPAVKTDTLTSVTRSCETLFSTSLLRVWCSLSH